ncbi:MAG: hypothetical protein Q8S73_02775 [Deltaproteobacteria bacterium]|nr:hypothetical protein [Myxococcales bacterium]MDP3213002.1 hypothetical protein [Deltaproteobacteria bacterium]
MPQRRRRQLPSPAYAEVHAILERPWLVDAGLLEGIANDVHERTNLPWPFAAGSGQILAAHLEYLVIPRQDVGCGVGGLLPRVLLVRSSADDLRWNLRVLHELAHALLDGECPQHSHADVWALTLALAIPRRSFRLHHEARHVPRWAVALRRLTARVVARAA